MVEQVDLTEEETSKIIRSFIESNGKLKQLPAQRKKRLILLAYMLRELSHGKQYTEKEINEHILRYHEDFASIRREFVMSHFMYRQDGVYELNPKEMWPVR